MKQFYYVFKTLLREKGPNLIKVISLSLGLVVSLLLFAMVAFELSFNSSYKESEKLCVVMSDFRIEGEKTYPYAQIYAPIPSTLAEAFPNEIESTTVIRNHGNETFFRGTNRHTAPTIIADSAYFQTTGIELLAGNPLDLSTVDVIFISKSFARNLFGDENPMGKTLLMNKKHEFTIKGIYADIPENTEVRHDVVISFPTLVRYDWFYTGWNAGDAFMGFIRVKEKSDVSKINKRINTVIGQYTAIDPNAGYTLSHFLMPVREQYISDPTVKWMNIIMIVLATAMLTIAALNYILVTVSSLPRRAKSIGVHKCNGADNSNIFSMFLLETLLIIFISLLLAVIIIINLRGVIEDYIDYPLSTLLSWNVMWAPATVLVILFIVVGVLPGRLFSSIPVTQVFRRYTESKRVWKRPLLFIQFLGVAFIFGLFCVVYAQYREIVNYDIGFKPDRIATVQFNFDNLNAAKATLLGLPMVEDVAVAENNISYGYSGTGITDENGKRLFTSRINICDYNYVPLIGIEIVEGKNFDGPGQVLINESFVERMKWTDSPIGKRYENEYTIVGVMKDFVYNSFYTVKEPFIMLGENDLQGCMTVKLKEPFKENLIALNDAMAQIYPTEDIIFSSLPDRVSYIYKPVTKFRNIVSIAFVVIFLITLMGLWGYVTDEVNRRSKEIAIRKVNGAEAWNILMLLSKEISWLAIPAIIIGITIAAIGSNIWQGYLEGVEAKLSILTFILIGLGVLLFILITVVLKAWNIANENPVKSIKNE